MRHSCWFDERLHTRSRLRLTQRKFDEAAQLYTRALAIEEKVLGPDHPDLATTLNNLGVVSYNLVRVLYIWLIELV